jgi:chemotaxis protein methyltransferase CheR
MQPDAIDDIEMRLLMQGVRQVYGHDFLDYSEASLKRRLKQWLAGSGFATFSQAQSAVLRDPALFESLLQGITVNVTEMFRDPAFFLALRVQVIPFLKTYPFVKIWLAGCATGEEAYSIAILLHEAGMRGRYRLYATDINEAALQRAKDGIYPLKALQTFTRNYQKSGAKASFADYYTARYEHAIVMAALKENLIFAHHNLVTDTDIGEMNLILCRNVMIYFQSVLKERCVELFDGCLRPGGFLCLGMKERLDGRAVAHKYDKISPHMSIYRKRYG